MIDRATHAPYARPAVLLTDYYRKNIRLASPSTLQGYPLIRNSSLRRVDQTGRRGLGGEAPTSVFPVYGAGGPSGGAPLQDDNKKYYVWFEPRASRPPSAASTGESLLGARVPSAQVHRIPGHPFTHRAALPWGLLPPLSWARATATVSSPSFMLLIFLPSSFAEAARRM